MHNPHAVDPHLNYRPDIDGLRALAVLAVLIFHAFPKALPGGFVGVDIFFVISGYLISRIIFTGLEQNNFTFRDFYARRIRRIFPALLIVLLACLLFGWFVLLPNEFTQLGKHVLGGTGFTANFVLWSEAGYFDTAAKSKPLLHLWSLGIEEQFYVFWPLLLWGAWKFRHKFLWLVALIFAVSFTLNILQSRAHDVAAFYSPLTRFWELLAGAGLAWCALHRPQIFARYQNAQSVLGLVLIVAGLILINKHSAFPGWWALLPVLGATLLISAGPQGFVNRRILSHPGAVWFGLISYPLYLWHWPLLAYGNIIGDKLSDLIRGGLLLLSILLAWLTYKCLEKPIRFQFRHSVRWLIAGAAILSLLGAAAWQTSITPRHHDPKIDQVVGAAADWDFLVDIFTPFKIDGYNFYDKHAGAAKVLFWGDSHLEQYAPRINKLLNDDPQHSASIIYATRGGCSPANHIFDDEHPDCPQNMKTAAALAARDDVTAVVIGGCWNCYFVESTKADSKYDYYFDDHGKKIFFKTGAGINQALAEFAQQIRALSAKKKVFLILDSPMSALLDPMNFFEGSRWGELHATDAQQSITIRPDADTLRRRLRQIGERNGAIVIDPISHLCRKNVCPAVDANGAPIYKDKDHLRASYAREHAGFMDQTVR